MKKTIKTLLIFSILFIGTFSFAGMDYQKGFMYYKKGIKLLKSGNELKGQALLKKALEKFLKVYETKKDSAILNYYIGQIYFNGWGTKKDPEKALKYIKTAYENGTDKAACELLLIKKELHYPDIEIRNLFDKINKHAEIKAYCERNYPKKFSLLK